MKYIKSGSNSVVLTPAVKSDEMCQRGCHKPFPFLTACDTDVQGYVWTVEGNAVTSSDHHPEDAPLVSGPCSLSCAFAVVSGFKGISFLNKKYKSIIMTFKTCFRI